MCRYSLHLATLLSDDISVSPHLASYSTGTRHHRGASRSHSETWARALPPTRATFTGGAAQASPGQVSTPPPCLLHRSEAFRRAWVLASRKTSKQCHRASAKYWPSNVFYRHSSTLRRISFSNVGQATPTHTPQFRMALMYYRPRPVYF